MPGPGGPGGGGPGGGGPGGRGGPGGPGGFHGGGPGFGGPGFRGGPGHHPPPAGMFFGGPGLRPGYGYGGPPPGPMGGPWCCWPFLCVLVFVITVSVGVTLIQTLDDCSTDDTDGKTSETTCVEYEGVYALFVGIIILCCCCWCMRSGEQRHMHDGTPGERQPMLASEAPPPPAMVYGNAVAVEASKPTVTGTAYVTKT